MAFQTQFGTCPATAAEICTDLMRDSSPANLAKYALRDFALFDQAMKRLYPHLSVEQRQEVDIYFLMKSPSLLSGAEHYGHKMQLPATIAGCTEARRRLKAE